MTKLLKTLIGAVSTAAVIAASAIGFSVLPTGGDASPGTPAACSVPAAPSTSGPAEPPRPAPTVTTRPTNRPTEVPPTNQPTAGPAPTTAYNGRAYSTLPDVTPSPVKPVPATTGTPDNPKPAPSGKPKPEWYGHDKNPCGSGLMAYPDPGQTHCYNTNWNLYGWFGVNGWSTNNTFTASGGSTCLFNNGFQKLVMQQDGNLVLYATSDNYVYWASGTNGNVGARWEKQSNGNLVIYKFGTNTVLWQSYTAGVQNPYFTLQDDHNVVLYGTNCGGWCAYWTTNTGF
ncbi:hypothetical protein [Longispora urticae]